MSENTGRSYRRTSSRYADSAPARASATTSWADKDWRSFAVGMGRVIYPPHAAQSASGPLTMTPSTLPVRPGDRRQYVREMFSDIAPRYDLLNHVLSLNIDRAWRRRAVARLGWEVWPDGGFLDACAGPRDLAPVPATRRGFRGRVVGADFALPMLHHGADKPPAGLVARVAADTLQLPFGDAGFDGAIVG